MFITAANRNAIISPCAPPSRSPITSRIPLSAPSSSTVFTPFAMGLFYLVQAGHDTGEKRGAPGEIRQHHVLVERMRTVPLRTQSIKCWDAERRREVPVG